MFALQLASLLKNIVYPYKNLMSTEMLTHLATTFPNFMVIIVCGYTCRQPVLTAELCTTPGAYEPPKAAKERVTCVSSKYKFKRGTGRGYLCMYYGNSQFQ